MTSSHRLPNRTALLGALLLLPGCARELKPPDLNYLYDRAAQEDGPSRNPVILIPGILGSSLTQNGTDRPVWGAFSGNYAKPSKADGARLIALPMADGVPLRDLVDDVREDGALESLHVRIFGLPIGVGAYINILLALGVGGYQDQQLSMGGGIDYGNEHFTCFQFSYDWRRDISENAALLHDFILEKEVFVQEQYRERFDVEVDKVRFDVVAHSMGGLLLRYYLRYGNQPLPNDGSLPELDWSGAPFVERAVLVATPNAGSVQAFSQLMEGFKLGPFLPRYGAAILGTMPSIYQLLPRPRHGFLVDHEKADHPLENPYDPATWIEHGWGLANPKEDKLISRLLPDEPDPDRRRRIALDHLTKCLASARQLAAALDLEARPPSSTELILAAGDAVETPRRVSVDPVRKTVKVVEWNPGDGTVVRGSALLDERMGGDWQPKLDSPIAWNRVMFFFEDHLGLTKSPAFIDNLLFLLLEEERDRPSKGRAGG